MKNYFINFTKGLAMGAANVIPGVSGGTIALITGIFQRIINSIKSFNITAFSLLFKGEFKEFIKYTDLYFLISVFFGAVVSIFSLAKILSFLFSNYPIHVWAYFFGLILASVYFVGKTINKWSFSTIVFFILGTAIAILISVLNPAKENDSVMYLFVCGIIAACSMILPGLSGSFILILLGNYHLVMIDSVTNFDMVILLPVVLGAGFGLLAFSHLLSWIYKKFRNQTIALLTGFILGSLSILWPWKNVISTYIDKHGIVKPLLQKNILPNHYFDITNNEPHIIAAVILLIVGFLTIVVIEKFAQTKTEDEN
ncbi:MAG: DUF368 domain-containing protein [Bacteroidales bacterium]|nr:DUF368 domain-containing protein [Bacteroidales bacterium]